MKHRMSTDDQVLRELNKLPVERVKEMHEFLDGLDNFLVIHCNVASDDVTNLIGLTRQVLTVKNKK